MNDFDFDSRLRRLMHATADSAPAPGSLPKTVRRRVRFRQFGTAFAAIVVSTALIVGGTVAVVRTTGQSQPIGPSEPSPTDIRPPVAPSDIDAKATALIRESGNLCRAFDFQLKETIQEHVYRPVNCKVPGSGVLGRDGELVEPPEVRFVIRVFPTQDARRAWLAQTRDQVENPLLVGQVWTVEILDSSLTQPLHDRLGGRLLRPRS